jgi:hypothetical protein
MINYYYSIFTIYNINRTRLWEKQFDTYVWDGVDDSETQTSGTIRTGLPLTVVPEYLWGGLIAIGACFAAFAVVKSKKLLTPKASL